MISGFIIKKGQMTSMFLENGKRIAVTKCQASPLKVTQIKNIAKDGYEAVQVAYGSRKNIDKPTSSKLTKIKLDIKPKNFKEFKLSSDQLPEVASEITIDSVFAVGDIVSATGTSKGHGFAGVIKRHGFHRQPVTGGQSDRTRAPGSIGAQTPSKVVRGKKMPGHYGNVTKTVTNLKVVAINKDKNEIIIGGPMPGHFNSWITLSK